MRVEADRDICCGAGNCVRTAPGVFDQDDAEGLVVVLRPDPGEELGESVRRAAHLCPVGAITVR